MREAERLDWDIALYLEAKGVRPSCRAGCFYCCYPWVTLSRLEAEAIRPHLTPAQKERVLREGPRRLALLRERKDDPGFPGWFFQKAFQEGTPCPLLEEGLCGVYPHRPLACRGVLTESDPERCRPDAPQPSAYLQPPLRMARLRMEALWEEERARYGFLVLGEVAGLLYLLERLPKEKEEAVALLEGLGVLGGRWGYQVV
ncbi:YkgJ family cysteine cluster protein [Thermus filiformis]|uniref:Uncharacterized protein n=1 Tax=Thermus filiformis TaxID=276 RepID=A0A0A2WQ53_THEFI|nr:YkgJ family cysteine cluster protein [Thermus filiformis]KGQ22286.2 hypothetical protein THFILI_03395 [Thermus filiformis]